MINLIQKFSTKKISKENFIQEFINHPNHHWIKNDKRIEKAITILLTELKPKHIEKFIEHKTYLIPCEAHLSCAIGKTKNDHLILVFPELITLLRSASFHHGLSILAHELGHIYYQHTENKIETLQAQIEADDFAFELGYGEELQEILLDHNFSIDCKVRISKLTAKLIERRNFN